MTNETIEQRIVRLQKELDEAKEDLQFEPVGYQYFLAGLWKSFDIREDYVAHINSDEPHRTRILYALDNAEELRQNTKRWNIVVKDVRAVDSQNGPYFHLTNLQYSPQSARLIGDKVKEIFTSVVDSKIRES